MAKNPIFRFFQTKKIDKIFYIILIACSILVIAKIKDFGVSWDEPLYYDFSAFLPKIYLKAAQGIAFDEYDQFLHLKWYGPAFLVLGEFPARGLDLFPFWDIYDAWHIINYAVFVLGTVSLYWVCQKFADKLAAMFAALLYFSQPLLFGHGIMNPKDTPFASFFILSIALGIKMIDAARDEPSRQPIFLSRIIPGVKKWYGRLLIFIAALIILDRVGKNFILLPIISTVIKWASGLSSKFLFPQSSHYLPVEYSSYLEKIITITNLVNTIFLCILVVILLFRFIKYSTNFQRSVFWAGIALGLTTSTRVLGPAAGGLILLIWILQEKPKKIFFPAIGYIAITIITVYFTWPYLWKAPVFRFIESFQVMMKFPWNNTLLFDGKYYSASSLPWYYLVKLICIQLTIPAIVLFCIGTVLALFSLYKYRLEKGIYLLPLLWFYVPLAAWVLYRPITYDNFRQFLFIIPPIFVLSALGFSFILEHVKNKTTGYLIGLILLLPGFLSGIYLHPYQYVYYNEFVGGTSNIYERYEADYWGTSTCEAAKYLDPKIDSKTRIFLFTEMFGRLFNRCTQQTPQLFYKQDEDPAKFPDYAIVLSRWGAEKYFYTGMDIIHSISRGKTPLVVIRKAP